MKIEDTGFEVTGIENADAFSIRVTNGSVLVRENGLTTASFSREAFLALMPALRAIETRLAGAAEPAEDRTAQFRDEDGGIWSWRMRSGYSTEWHWCWRSDGHGPWCGYDTLTELIKCGMRLESIKP